MLLLMPHSPAVRHVFEIYVPRYSKRKGGTLTLVEVRWTRAVPFPAESGGSLVGVKFLLSPSSPLRKNPLLAKR